MEKVFICIPTLEIAGAERFVTDLAINLDQSKFEAVVIVTNKLRNSFFYNQLVEKSICVYDVSARFYFQEFWKIFKMLKNEQPNIVHTNIGSMLHMLLPVAFYGHATHLFTVHSMANRTFEGIKKKIASFAFHFNLVVPIAISDAVKDSMEEEYHLDAEQIECIYDGVDVSKYDVKTLYHTKYNQIIISVGSLYPVKNHKLLIDAYNEVYKKYPLTELWILGDGEMKAELQKQIDTLGLGDAVKLLGKVTNVGDYLAKADIYCCVSYTEGLSIAALEAMSVGLPIVTTAAGGIENVIREDDNAYVVGFEPDEVAKKIIKLIENPNLMVDMGKKSREVVLKYDIRMCVQKYQQLYEKYL